MGNDLTPLKRQTASALRIGDDGLELLSPRQLIQAQTDEEAVEAWVGGCSSRHTAIAYRKEGKRFLYWLRENGQSLRSMTMEDLVSYRAFLSSLSTMAISDPAESKRWLSGGRYSVSDERWRPFMKPLSQESQRQALLCVTILLSFLEEAGYIGKSPATLVKIHKIRKRKSDRYLKWSSRKYIDQAVDSLPENTARQYRYKVRARFIFALFTLTAARLSDVPQAKMSDIQPSAQGSWWWEVTGKGDKDDSIPVPSELLSELKRYRRALGKEALPSRQDDDPLIISLDNRDTPLTANALYRTIVKIMRIAASFVPEEEADVAYRLRHASPHWLRHTALTHQVEQGVELRYTQLNARHEDINTTMGYVHGDNEARHEQTDKAMRGESKRGE